MEKKAQEFLRVMNVIDNKSNDLTITWPGRDKKVSLVNLLTGFAKRMLDENCNTLIATVENGRHKVKFKGLPLLGVPNKPKK